MEYGRYDGDYYRKSNNNNNVYRYSNRHERLYKNCYCHGNCKSDAICDGKCYAFHHLCRSEQHPERYRRRHLFLEYRCFYGFYYSKPGCHYYLLGNGNTCCRLLRYRYNNCNGQSASKRYGDAKPCYHL